MGAKFISYETHISAQMQFLSDNGLYGFASIESENFFIRTKTKQEPNPSYLTFVPISDYHADTRHHHFEHLSSSLHKSPLDKQSGLRIELDVACADVHGGQPSTRRPSSAYDIDNATLLVFWHDEVDRRAMHKVDVELCMCMDDAINTQADDSLEYTACVDVDAVYNQINQAVVFVRDCRDRATMPVSSIPVNDSKIAKYHRLLQGDKWDMRKNMIGRFKEYASRKKFRDKYNFAVDSDEDADSNEEGFEVLQYNKLHVKHQYLKDFTGHQRRLKFDDGIAEPDESKKELLIELKQIVCERTSQLIETKSLIHQHSKLPTSENYSGASKDELIVLSFNEPPPKLITVVSNHQMYHRVY